MTNIESNPEYFQPAEWAPHRAVWTAWPAAGEYWLEYLQPAQEQFTEMCRHIAPSEPMKILVVDEAAQAAAEQALRGLNVSFFRVPYGDIWLRDTAPIFLHSRATGKLASLACFQFNGWGEKYLMPPDDQVGVRIAEIVGLPVEHVPLVFEGGSLDVDGCGTALTTRECLLNANRNPALTQGQIEQRIGQAVGVSKFLWLDYGLRNDHTDGHIDNLARFVGEGHVVCMAPSGPDDPNREVYDRVYQDLLSMRDALGRELTVTRIASPGLVRNHDGDIVPASHMNFYIGNATVVVPTYNTPYDDEAVAQLAECFPGRKTVGLSADAILTGGGSFHCITQQEPW